MLCPCGSASSYGQCCQPLHEGGYAASALQLMRSRYSAYALSKPDYIIRTTHSANPHFQKDRVKWAFEILQFCQTTLFERLEIIEFTETTVHFIAHLKQKGAPFLLKEKSTFAKQGKQWLYLSGSVFKQ